MFYEASSARTSNTQLGCHWVAAALSSFRIRCSNASNPLQFLSRDASPEALYSITPKCSQHLELRFDTANGELQSVMQKQLAIELPLSASMRYYVASEGPERPPAPVFKPVGSSIVKLVVTRLSYMTVQAPYLHLCNEKILENMIAPRVGYQDVRLPLAHS